MMMHGARILPPNSYLEDLLEVSDRPKLNGRDLEEEGAK